MLLNPNQSQTRWWKQTSEEILQPVELVDDGVGVAMEHLPAAMVGLRPQAAHVYLSLVASSQPAGTYTPLAS
jgi:hypothetical protein